MPFFVNAAMQVELIVIGKTNANYLQTGIDDYVDRLKHYVPFKLTVIPDIKNAKSLSQEQLKIKEGELILKNLNKSDLLILLDENGKTFTSVSFSKYMQTHMLAGRKKVIFVIGGAYGFSKDVYHRSNGKVALSAMTFSHQMVRMIFVEQLYRAMTILKGEPYHHL